MLDITNDEKIGDTSAKMRKCYENMFATKMWHL